MKVKKIFALVLSLSLIFSLGCLSPAYADAAPANERASWQISTTGSDSITILNTTCSVRFSIVLTVRNEASNNTGGCITGVNSVTVSNVSGWTAVASQPVSYSLSSTADNGQIATVHIVYSASLGHGYSSYDADVVIRLADL